MVPSTDGTHPVRHRTGSGAKPCAPHTSHFPYPALVNVLSFSISSPSASKQLPQQGAGVDVFGAVLLWDMDITQGKLGRRPVQGGGLTAGKT